MATTTTYSFADLDFVISHPSVGQFVANGEGLGNMNVTMQTDRTQQDVAADGSIMVSKVEGENGNFVFNVQQTSAFVKWLINAYNYVSKAPTSEWAQFTISARSVSMSLKIVGTGAAFQIAPEQQFQQQGQELSVTMPAAHVAFQPF